MIVIIYLMTVLLCLFILSIYFNIRKPFGKPDADDVIFSILLSCLWPLSIPGGVLILLYFKVWEFGQKIGNMLKSKLKKAKL